MKKPLPSAFLDRLMLQVDPHRAPLDPTIASAKIYCGRWLALQRVQLDYSLTQLSNMTGIAADILQNLEWGLATVQDLTDSARQNLAWKIYPHREDNTWVKMVIALALGQADAYDESAMLRVRTALEMAGQPTVQLEHTLAQTIVTPPALFEDLFVEMPELFEVLRALLNLNTSADRHIYAIWNHLVRKRVTIDMAMVGIILARVQSAKLVIVTESTDNARVTNKPRQLYEITDDGRAAFFAECQRRMANGIISEREVKVLKGELGRLADGHFI